MRHVTLRWFLIASFLTLFTIGLAVPRRAVPISGAATLVKHPQLPEGVTPQMWSGIRTYVEREQRKIRPWVDGSFVANAKACRAVVRESGISISPSNARDTWRIGWGWARVEGLTTEPARLKSADHVITAERGEIREWFENRMDGLEHFVEVKSNPSSSGTLQVRIPVETKLDMKSEAGSDAISFHDPEKGNVEIEYRGLKVTDARQVVLNASLGVEGTSILISVSDENACYPVTIDPLLRNGDGSHGIDGEVGSRFLDGSVEEFGFSVANAIYVLGGAAPTDHCLIVGAPGWDSEAGADVGAAFVFPPFFANPSARYGYHWVWYSTGPNQPGARFGAAVGPAGDVDDDGFYDIVIGAPGYDSLTVDNCGAMYVYLGSPDGPQENPWICLGDEQQDAALGTSVYTAGQTNADAFWDVVAGAPGYNTGSNDNAGAVYFFLGSAGGLPTAGTPPVGTYSQRIDGPAETDAQFGFSVSIAGDINGDGLLDFIVGAPYLDQGGNTDNGAAFIYPGPLGSPPTALQIPGPAEDDAWFGFDVCHANNVNGDLVPGGTAPVGDVIIGAPGVDAGGFSQVGAAYVYYGDGDPVGGINMVLAWGVTGPTAQDDAMFGWSVSAAGDSNADGFDDVAVGAPFLDDLVVGADVGEVYVYFYDPLLVSLPAIPSCELNPNLQADANFGFCLAIGMNKDGDGIFEVIASSPGFDYTVSYVGSVNVTDGGQIQQFEPVAAGIPGNMLCDIKVADRMREDGFGASVASAGDVNGDTVPDIIVGVPQYCDVASDTWGAAFIFHGGSGGLQAEPDTIILGGAMSGTGFAAAVSSAGDIDGDGFGDVAVSHPYVDTVYVYLGSATGVVAAAPEFTLTVTEANRQVGVRLIGGVSINGDAYPDLIAAAPRDGNTYGVVHVFIGDADDYSVARIWTLTGLTTQTAEDFGRSIAVIPSVGGDALPEVAVGAPNYTATVGLQTFNSAGRVYVFYGNSVEATFEASDWTSSGPMRAYTNFGSSVSGGLINGGSVGDLVVGAPGYDRNGQGNQDNAGRAYVFYGTGFVLPGSISATITGPDVASAVFGNLVAVVGDTDGTAGDEFIVTTFSVVQDFSTYLYTYSGGIIEESNWIADDNDWSYYGQAVAGVGDFDDDGYNDFVVTAPQSEDWVNRCVGRMAFYAGGD